ncbi:MAG: hypothetical protein ACJ8DI_00340 [Ktedonobacteraceae bacterium]
MAKTVSSYQEIGHLIDGCTPVVFTCHPVARVTVLQRAFPENTVKVTINLSIGDTCVGIVANEYASITDLLDAFQIDDLDEIWEVLE